MNLHTRTANLLQDTARLVRQRFDQTIRPIGLTEARWRAVGYVNTWPGLTQTELAELLDIEKAPAGTLVDKLQREGLLRRELDMNDRRVNRLFLQPAAAPVIQQMQSAFAHLHTELAETFTTAQQDMLWGLLNRLRHGLLTETDLESRQQHMSKDYLTVIGSLARLLRRRMSRPLREMGFTPAQWWLLCAVQWQGGLTQTALAEQLGIGKVPLGQLLDALEKEGWIQRTGVPTDRRAKQIDVAPQAATRLDALIAQYASLHQQQMSVLSDAELVALNTLLEALRGCLAELRANPLQAHNQENNGRIT